MQVVAVCYYLKWMIYMPMVVLGWLRVRGSWGWRHAGFHKFLFCPTQQIIFVIYVNLHVLLVQSREVEIFTILDEQCKCTNGRLRSLGLTCLLVMNIVYGINCQHTMTDSFILCKVQICTRIIWNVKQKYIASNTWSLWKMH